MQKKIDIEAENQRLIEVIEGYKKATKRLQDLESINRTSLEELDDKLRQNEEYEQNISTLVVENENLKLKQNEILDSLANAKDDNSALKLYNDELTANLSNVDQLLEEFQTQGDQATLENENQKLLERIETQNKLLEDMEKIKGTPLKGWNKQFTEDYESLSTENNSLKREKMELSNTYEHDINELKVIAKLNIWHRNQIFNKATLFLFGIKHNTTCLQTWVYLHIFGVERHLT